MRADAREAAGAVARARGDAVRAREHLELALVEYDRKQDESGAARIRDVISELVDEP